MSDLVRLDTKQLTLLKKTGKNVLVDPQADKAIVALIDAKDQIDKALKEIKEEVFKQGEEMQKGFSGVEGQHVLFYKANGGSRMSLDRKYVEEYQKKHGKLPESVVMIPTSDRLVIRVKKA